MGGKNQEEQQQVQVQPRRDEDRQRKKPEARKPNNKGTKTEDLVQFKKKSNN